MLYFSRSILGIMPTRFGPGNVARRLDRHDTASIRSQRMSRTIKAKRYSTLAACIRRSIGTTLPIPLAIDVALTGEGEAIRLELTVDYFLIDHDTLPRWRAPCQLNLG